MSLEKIKISTFNTRGLGDTSKRILVFNWLQSNYKGIIFLQETHSTVETEKAWSNQWGGKIIFCHGTSRSRGVAILLSPDISSDIVSYETDGDGRFIAAVVELNDHRVVLCNIYAPTKDKPIEQKVFLDRTKEKLSPYMDEDILIGGDFNVCIEPAMDKKGGVEESQSVVAKALISLQEEFQLTDIWRSRHPNLKRFTRRERTVGGYVQSRLDYWLVSLHLQYRIGKVVITPGRRSDHSLVSLEWELQNTPKRGRGFWKFNTSLLRDEAYLNRIKESINASVARYEDIDDKRLVWDVIKCDIRTETISYATHKNKINTETERELTKRLNELEIALAENSTEDLEAEYNTVTGELNSLLMNKTRGAMLRSKAKWVEEGEKNTSYFLKLEKRNQKLKCIAKLQAKNGETITNQDDILREEMSFYQTLYSEPGSPTGDNSEVEESFLNNQTIPKLTEDRKLDCDLDIELEECAVALKELPNGKSPGCDGLPAEFYKMFWSHIGPLVLNSYHHSFEHGELSIDQRRGVITLIPKQDKDLRSLNNWRPISLLNCDYKILAKVLANRLQTVIPNLINMDQSGFIKRRFIGDNIRTISDIIDYCNLTKEGGFLALLDFQKAFDSVRWSFLYKTLLRFNFGDKLIRWIKLLYSNISSCVTNNGNASAFFSVERGVRQGCPVSPLLFILVAEVLACNIRSDPTLLGISVGDEVFKICQLADDTTLFIKDLDSLGNAFKVLERFSQISGLKLNKKKTQVIPLNIDIALLPDIGIKWIDDNFKTLGIWFSTDLEKALKLNFSRCLDNIKTLLNIWKQRDLSLKGKVTILKSLIVPKLIYPASMLAVPQWFVEAADKLFFSFLWDGKPPKIKKRTIIGDIENGGLKMPHIDSIVNSLKLAWLSRFLNTNIKGRWKALSRTLIGLGTGDFCAKLKVQHLPNEIRPFYKQVLVVWFNIYTVEPETYREILEESIWRNSFITVDNSPIVYKHWEEHGIVAVQDLINKDNGMFLNAEQLAEKYSIDINAMMYNSLVSAIPRHWKKTIRDLPKPITHYTVLDVEDPPGVPSLKITGKLVPITTLKTGDFYKVLISREFMAPTAITRWSSLHPEFVELCDWKYIFTLPYNIVRSTKLQTLQYKILNRIFACKENLATWKICESNLCTDCHVPETIEHYFFECPSSQMLWKSFELWFYNSLGVRIPLCATTIVFGTNNLLNDDLLFLMDFCIMTGKWYIFKQKYCNKSVSFIELLLNLKNNVNIEKHLLYLEGKIELFESKWKELYEAL